MLATIVDFAALSKVLLIVRFVGVGITALYGQGIVSLERLAEARRAGNTGAVVPNGLFVRLEGLVCATALVAGLLALMHKETPRLRPADHCVKAGCVTRAQRPLAFTERKRRRRARGAK